ncbi:ABC transporter ATP-binding protein [Photobacterium sp. TY1-4]|uniref:ABC transporter ATP-binding protein n=1 Tax=Photobacterium sp. TY1-4 TaxID=2899122 RepID=UPI0028F738C5|nr:ABC transporter ATP-binding protein [Photobacterium sp. TY1-4]
MTTVSATPSYSTHRVFPAHARRRLLWISLGWCLVAALEAAAYTVLAWAIATQQSPEWVVFTASVTVLATIWVTRAGFFSGVRLAGDLFATLGQALGQAKLSWFTDAHRTQVAMLAGRGIPGFMSIPAHQLQTFLHAPLIPLFLVAGIAWLTGPGVALGVGCLLTLSLVIQFKAQRALSQADKKRHDADKGTAQATIEFVDHLELLRTTAGPVRAIARLEQQWQTQENVLAGTTRAAARATLVSAIASALPLASIAAYLAVAGITEPALALALLVLVARAAAPLGELALAGLSINDLRAALNDYRQIIAVPTLPEPSHRSASQPDGHHITLKHISQAPALSRINADIPPGTTVVISGPSGCGKSTLLELLMRFDDPQRGVITFGGVPLNQMRYADLSKHIAYVAQDPIVFTGTLAENIRLSRPEASDEDVTTAARRAMLGSVIDRSPQGIHQTVGHQGGAFSGGERQRVAIARALIKGAPILILDEATAALDEETERRIAEVIRDLPATVILVTHRDPAIWQPTQIIALADLAQAHPEARNSEQDPAERSTTKRRDGALA